VGITAALATQTYSSPALKEELRRLIGSFFARYFSGAGFKAIQPERTQALYYPSWCIDAEAEAKAWFSDTEDSPEVSNSGILEGGRFPHNVSTLQSVTVQFRHA